VQELEDPNSISQGDGDIHLWSEAKLQAAITDATVPHE
jgi:hypothetical protein